MATITRFEEIDAWKTARELTKVIYSFTKKADFSKDFGLRNQIQRAAVSVMSNIAEGYESQTQATFISYLSRAKASAGEVRSQLYVALDLEYITKDEFDQGHELVDKVSRQIFKFKKYLESQPNVRRISESSVFYEV